MIFKMLSNKNIEKLSLLKEGKKRTGATGDLLALPSPGGGAVDNMGRRGPQHSQSKEQKRSGWPRSSGKQPPLPKGCQVFPHPNTLTCANRERLSSKTSFKDCLDLGREGVDLFGRQS